MVYQKQKIMNQFSFNYKVPKKFLYTDSEVWIIANCVGGYKDGNVSLVINQYSFTWISDMCSMKIETLGEVTKDIRQEAEKFYLKTFVHGK